MWEREGDKEGRGGEGGARSGYKVYQVKCLDRGVPEWVGGRNCVRLGLLFA